jgi:hypothetical protein
MDSNPYQPFELLTFIAAPALLTNASSLLILSTSNRFARAVDRARSLRREHGPAGDIELANRRAHMLAQALVAFYIAVSVFALGTFIELLGGGLASIGHERLAPLVIYLGIASGAIGMLAIAAGSALLSVETTLAYGGLVEEASRKES